MRTATYNGPTHRLILGTSGRVLERGMPTEITEDEASRFGEHGPWAEHDVTVEPRETEAPPPPPEPQPDTQPQEA